MMPAVSDTSPAAAPWPVVVFDLDGTLLNHPESIWRTLHERFISDPVRRKQTVQRAMSGEITYAQWFAEDVALLRERGVTRAMLEEVGRSIPLTPGAPELVRDLRRAGVRVGILSGGLDVVRQAAAPDLVVDREFINRITFRPDGQISGGTPTDFDGRRKAAGLRLLAEAWGHTPSEVAFIGDGSNDVAAAEIAGCSVAWGAADRELAAVATHRIPGPSMDALRPLLLGPLP